MKRSVVAISKIGAITVFGLVIIWFYLNITFFHKKKETKQNVMIHQFPNFYGLNEINCSKLIQNDIYEVERAYYHMQRYSFNIFPEEEIIRLAINCSVFRGYMHNSKFPVSVDELNFPLAFIILMYKDVEQTLRLLRAIYRPNNFYCIHVDLSASEQVHAAVKVVVRCYDNVFVVSKREDIIYGHVSRLRAELNCMSDLMKKRRRWKYVLNIPSQQYPLKTNAEMVQFLKRLNGFNIIEGIKNPNRTLSFRYNKKYLVINKDIWPIWKKAPFKYNNISIVKGLAIGAFSYNFVKFVLQSKIAKELLNWMADVSSPDEYFWSTLNHNPSIQAPGRYKDNQEMPEQQVVYISWYNKEHKLCHGKYVRDICIFGIEDLPLLTNVPHLLLNKLYIDCQPLTYDCLEEWYFRKATLHQAQNNIV